MIVDVHSHDFPDGIAIRAMSGMYAKIREKISPVGDGTLSNHLDHLELAGVDLAVSCPIATRPDMFEGLLRRSLGMRDGAFGARAQRMIVPFASVHPKDPDVMAHLERIASVGLKGVKFHCYYQGFSLSDHSCWPMFAKIAELGLVVQCHCGEDLGWDDVGLCGPGEIADLLSHVSGLKFIAAHLGGCAGYPAHATDPLRDLGCYIDTSAIHTCWSRDEQMRLLRSWPTDRLLFGTDFPWVHYPEAIRWVREIRDPADWEAVFAGNARRLLGI